jgi:hypothetical protein
MQVTNAKKRFGGKNRTYPKNNRVNLLIFASSSTPEHCKIAHNN